MRNLAIRLAAALATAVVLASGAFWFRELFVEYDDGFHDWASATTIEVDAADGVRVGVERGRPGDGVVADLQWHSRSALGRAEVDTIDGVVNARCPTPTPVSRCAVWLTIRTADPRVRVVITQRPGATVDGLDPRVDVEVRRVP